MTLRPCVTLQAQRRQRRAAAENDAVLVMVGVAPGHTIVPRPLPWRRPAAAPIHRHARAGHCCDGLSLANAAVNARGKTREGVFQFNVTARSGYLAASADSLAGIAAPASSRVLKNCANRGLTIGADSPCLSKLFRNGIGSVARNCSRISSCASSPRW